MGGKMAVRSSAGAVGPQAGRTVTLDPALPRKAAAEFVGTALLVFVGCGVATVNFGFHGTGASVAAGVLTTALAFGLTLVVLSAIMGPVSGCHVNPAVTLGMLLAKRITVMDAVGYWIAQFLGGIAGALLLLWLMISTHLFPGYSRAREGLGANAWGSPSSLLRASAGGAFLVEVIVTAIFVLVVLSVTSKGSGASNRLVCGGMIGLGLAVGHLVAIPVDGASLNPARSLGPALVVQGQAIRQVWLFILAPLVGAVFAAGLHLLFHPDADDEGGRFRFGRLTTQSSVSHAAADEGARPAGLSTSATAPQPGATAPQPGAAGTRPVQGGTARGATPASNEPPGSGPAEPPQPGSGPRQ
jgi:aquaporin Z